MSATDAGSGTVDTGARWILSMLYDEALVVLSEMNNSSMFADDGLAKFAKVALSVKELPAEN